MSNIKMIAFTFLLFLSLIKTTVYASDAPTGFKTPSNNIFCDTYKNFNNDNHPDITLQCDIVNLPIKNIPPKPKDCQFEWGHAFAISGQSKTGKRLCYSDTVRNDSLPLLAYGTEWKHKSFTCKLEKSGLICINKNKHGFMLSRSNQKIF